MRAVGIPLARTKPATVRYRPRGGPYFRDDSSLAKTAGAGLTLPGLLHLEVAVGLPSFLGDRGSALRISVQILP